MPPIAADLELDRLRHREARLVRALTVLEARAANMAGAGHPIPAPLASAVVGFRDDLDDARAQLALHDEVTTRGGLVSVGALLEG